MRTVLQHKRHFSEEKNFPIVLVQQKIDNEKCFFFNRMPFFNRGGIPWTDSKVVSVAKFHRFKLIFCRVFVAENKL